MPTPADAPYKLAQAENQHRLRASRRYGRVNRRLLVQAVRLAVAQAHNPDLAPYDRVRAVKALKALVPTLTRGERRLLGLL